MQLKQRQRRRLIIPICFRFVEDHPDVSSLESNAMQLEIHYVTYDTPGKCSPFTPGNIRHFTNANDQHFDLEVLPSVVIHHSSRLDQNHDIICCDLMKASVFGVYEIGVWHPNPIHDRVTKEHGGVETVIQSFVGP